MTAIAVAAARRRTGGCRSPLWFRSLVHPTVTWGLNKQLLLFALTSIPVSQSWRDPADEQQFRVGLGTILTF